MKTYVQVDSGLVVEIIEPMTYDIDIYQVNSDGENELIHAKGDEVSISERFTPEFLSTLVDVSNESPMPQTGWTYNGSVFAPYTAPPQSPEQIIAGNTATRNQLLAAAALAIAPLQDANDLGEASDEEVALLKAWKQFRVAVNRIDLTKASIVWPIAPQPGYGAAVINPST